MAHVQTLLTWLKEIGKRKLRPFSKNNKDLKNVDKVSSSKDSGFHEEDDDIMMQNDLLFHIYEEIPACKVGNTNNNTTNTPKPSPPSLPKLDFARATEVGPYLVVPILGRGYRHGAFVGNVNEDDEHDEVETHSRDQHKDLDFALHKDLQKRFDSSPVQTHSPINRNNSVCLPDVECQMNAQWKRMREQRMKGKEDNGNYDIIRTKVNTSETDIRGTNTNFGANQQNCSNIDQFHNLVHDLDATVHKTGQITETNLDDDDPYSTIPALSVVSVGEEQSVAIFDQSKATLNSSALHSLHELIKESLEIISEQRRDRKPRRGKNKKHKRARSASRDRQRRHKEMSSDTDMSEYGSESSRSEDAYCFYLEKVKRNLELKQEVLKIIRDSESEADTTSLSTTYATYAGSRVSNGDDASMTTVNSGGSDNSTDSGNYTDTPMSTDLSEFDDCSHYYGTQQSNRTKQSSKYDKKLKNKSRNVLNMSSEDIGIEVFELDQTYDDIVLSASSSVKENYRPHSKTHENGSGKGKTSSSKHHDKLCTRQSKSTSTQKGIKTYGNNFDKLSCRATTYEPLPQSPSPSNTVRSPSPGNTNSGHYATGKGGSRGNNSMLQDMMRRNHDRQLFTLY